MREIFDIAATLHQIINKTNDLSWQWFWTQRIDGDLYAMGIDLNKVERIENDLLADLRQWSDGLQDNYPDIKDIPTIIARIKREFERTAMPWGLNERICRIMALCQETPGITNRAQEIGRCSDDIVEIFEFVINELENVEKYAPPKPLPTIFNTERETKAFQKAIDAGFMTKTETGYKWREERGMKARLAYFLERIYCIGATGAFPQKAVEKLFSVSRIDSSLTALHDAKSYLKWKWKPTIDALFDELD